MRPIDRSVASVAVEQLRDGIMVVVIVFNGVSGFSPQCALEVT